MSSARETAAEPVADARRWMALAVLLTATLLDLLDATIINIAIPSIQRDLDASYTSIQWIAAGYTLAFAVGLVTVAGSATSSGARKSSCSPWPVSPSRPRCRAWRPARTC